VDYFKAVKQEEMPDFIVETVANLVEVGNNRAISVTSEENLLLARKTCYKRGPFCDNRALTYIRFLQHQKVKNEDF